MIAGVQRIRALETGEARSVSLTDGDSSIRNIEVFERSWRRERAVSGIPYLSRPSTWPLALGYDSAALTLNVSETQVVGTAGTLSITLTFEDSADGVHWAQVGTALGIGGSAGTFRFALTEPFAAFLRVSLDIEASGATSFGLAEVQGSLTLRRRVPRRESGVPAELAQTRRGGARAASNGDCGCSG